MARGRPSNPKALRRKAVPDATWGRLSPREKYEKAVEAQREKPGAPNRSKYAHALQAQRRGGPSAQVLCDKPTPERITAALNMAGLDGPGVDYACGVEEPTVDLWESGELVPTREQVASLAMLTGFPWRFFYMPAPTPVQWGFICGEDTCEPLADLFTQRPDGEPKAVQESLF
jgi:hypothetical protein